MQDARRRALFAGVIGLVGAFLGIAGAGHAYLRQWRRALAWFSFVLGVAILLVSMFVDPQTTSPSEMPLIVTGPVLILLVLSALDAYRIARKQGSTTGDETAAAGEAGAEAETMTCPNCGREVDPELDFCHWCTERLPKNSQPSDASHE